MTAQKKAKELLIKFDMQSQNREYAKSCAKSCARICVEEMMSEWHNYYEAPISEKRHDYWQTVLTEIEKL